MQKSAIYKAIVGVAAIGALAFGGVALATSGTPAAAETAPAVVQTVPIQTSVPGTDATTQAVPAQSTEVRSTVDADNVQYESESEADDATELGTAEHEESSEAAESAEVEQPGDDGPGGHADELPASATNINPSPDHQFEGEE